MGSFHVKLAQIELQKNCQQNYQHKTQIKEPDTYIHSIVLKMELFISPKGTRLHKACEKQNKTGRATAKKHQQ